MRLHLEQDFVASTMVPTDGTDNSVFGARFNSVMYWQILSMYCYSPLLLFTCAYCFL